MTLSGPERDQDRQVSHRPHRPRRHRPPGTSRSMIDLSRNRAAFLAEIEAEEPQGEPLSDLADLRSPTPNAHVRVLGHGKKDLFPLLKLALSERFAPVPRLALNRDFLIPL